jgi:hypothetical protein
VLQDIVTTTLQVFKQPPLVSQVKGHQDNTTAYEQLPIEAQLNVDVGAAATLLQMEHRTTRYIVPIIVGNTAQLILNDKTVTYGYVKTIHNAYVEPLLRRYINNRNQWSKSDLSTINWTSLGAACNHHHAQQHFIVKLSHDLLPTRE